MKAYIDVVEYKDATGDLKQIYDDLIASRGKIANVHMIQSLNPKTIVAHMDLYMKIMFGKSPLRRYQREMLGVVVSQSNQCNYCVKHHAEALNFFWKDQDKTDRFSTDYKSIELNGKDEKLCAYAASLTLSPNAGNNAERIEALQRAELDDRSILDATLVVAYFNYVNRIVNGLGVFVEEEGAGGYSYD